MTETKSKNPAYARLPAKVLGCLNSGEMTIIIPVCGGSIETIPIFWLPPELRMPNCEFDILTTFPQGKWIRILHKGERCSVLEQGSKD